MSVAFTQGVRVDVVTAFLAGRSSPEQGEYLFAYTVRILNLGATTVQLLGRHWVITDGDGKVEEVRGPGVVGRQPVLRCGEDFQYTSTCPLPTPRGVMRGSYEMLRPDGTSFQAEVAPFELVVPPPERQRLVN